MSWAPVADPVERLRPLVQIAIGYEDDARQRARIAYSDFLGWLEIRCVAPHKTPIGRERDGYERAVLDLVLGGSATDP